MPVWTEDGGSIISLSDKTFELEAGTTYRIRNSSSTDIFYITEATALTSIPKLYSLEINVLGEISAVDIEATSSLSALGGVLTLTNGTTIDSTTPGTLLLNEVGAVKAPGLVIAATGLWAGYAGEITIGTTAIHRATDGAFDIYGVNAEVTVQHIHNTGLQLTTLTSLTDATITSLDLKHSTDGAPAAGIGNNISFTVETTSGNYETGMTLGTEVILTTAPFEKFDYVLNLMNGGSLAEVMRITAGGSLKLPTDSQLIGFGVNEDVVLWHKHNEGLDLISENVPNNSSNESLRLETNVNGTAQIGVGVHLGYRIETSPGNHEDGMQLGTVATNVTDLNEKFDFVLNLMHRTGTATASAEKMRVTSDGDLSVTGNISAATSQAAFHLGDDGFFIQQYGSGGIVMNHVSTKTNSVETRATFRHITYSTPAVGIGVGIDFQVENADGNDPTAMQLEAVATNVTNTNEKYDFVLNLLNRTGADTQASEKMRVTSTGDVEISGSYKTTGDVEISGSYKGYTSYIMDCSYYDSPGDTIFIPMTGVGEGSTANSTQQRTVMAYNGYLDKIIFRTVSTADDVDFIMHKASSGTDADDIDQNPFGATVSVVDGVAHTTVIANFGASYSFLAGDVVAIQMACQNSPTDCDLVCIFKILID